MTEGFRLQGRWQWFDKLTNQAEGKTLTGQGVSICLCPNRLGDCYKLHYRGDKAERTHQQCTSCCG